MDVKGYLKHLDLSIDRSTLAPEDRETARVEDRQGLGLSHKRGADEWPPGEHEIVRRRDTRDGRPKPALVHHSGGA
ncbi:MAG: hypothetical protein P4M07_08160 [Xanthobacteraceae bacterium]|nr:hypothetical protein [Xanthobacteraceae bacterium]